MKIDSAIGIPVAGLVRRTVRNVSAATSPPGPADRDPRDPRVRKTQAALLAAFNRLFLEKGFAAISPAEIASAAGVGRSTFYEHFASKAALLQHSVTVIVRPLADAAVGREAPHLADALRHIWDNRHLASRLLDGRPGVVVQDRLTALIAEAAAYTSETVVPVPMIAASVAAAQLALIKAWLTGRHACSIEQLAHALTSSGQGFQR